MTKIIGHRGARGLAPENTLAAIQKALDHHVDEIEIDLRVTKDGIPVLHHDRYMVGPNGRRVLIRRHALAELRHLQPGLATFDEAVRFLNRRVPLLVEIKPRVPVAPIVAVFNQYLRDGWQASDFSICSFSQITLLKMHKALPAISKVVNQRWFTVVAVARARQLQTKRLSIKHQYLLRSGVASLTRRGYEVYVFTLNDTAKAARWEKKGLLGVITDFPNTYRKK